VRIPRSVASGPARLRAEAEGLEEILDRYASDLESLDRLELLAMPRVEDHLPALAEVLRLEAS